MEFVGIRDVLRIALRQTILMMPYIIAGLIVIFWGEGRAWISRRNLLRRINRTAIDEISHRRIKKLEKENRELLGYIKRVEGEKRICERRLQTAFTDSDWGQEIIDKIMRDKEADETAEKNGGKRANKTRRVSLRGS